MIKKYRNRVVVISSILFSLLPFMAKASSLVQCGNEGQDPCKYTDLIVLINNILQFALFDIAVPLTAVMVIWGGILIMFSGGNESKVKKGKDIITGTFTGLVIAFGAWLIVDTFVKVLF